MATRVSSEAESQKKKKESVKGIFFSASGVTAEEVHFCGGEEDFPPQFHFICTNKTLSFKKCVVLFLSSYLLSSVVLLPQLMVILMPKKIHHQKNYFCLCFCLLNVRLNKGPVYQIVQVVSNKNI